MRGELPMPHEEINDDSEQYNESKAARMAENLRKMQKGMLDEVDEATRQAGRSLKLSGLMGLGGFKPAPASDDDED